MKNYAIWRKRSIHCQLVVYLSLSTSASLLFISSSSFISIQWPFYFLNPNNTAVFYRTRDKMRQSKRIICQLCLSSLRHCQPHLDSNKPPCPVHRVLFLIFRDASLNPRLQREAAMATNFEPPDASYSLS